MVGNLPLALHEPEAKNGDQRNPVQSPVGDVPAVVLPGNVHGRDGAPVRVTSFRKQCFDGLAVHVSDKLVLLPQCPCLSRERVVAQYLNIDVHRLTDFYRKKGVNIRQNEGITFFLDLKNTIETRVSIDPIRHCMYDCT